MKKKNDNNNDNNINKNNFENSIYNKKEDNNYERFRPASISQAMDILLDKE